MSFNDFERNFSETIKAKHLCDVFVTELTGIIPKEEDDVNLASESIVQFTLIGDAADSFSEEEILDTISYSIEKVELSKEPFMRLRYIWFLLNYDKRKMNSMVKVLELVNKEPEIQEILRSDHPFYRRVTRYILQHGKKMQPIRKDIWSLTEELLRHDSTNIIDMLSELKNFIENERDEEMKKRYFDFIENLIMKLEEQLEKEQNHHFLDRLYEEVAATSMPNLDKKDYIMRRGNLALKIAKEKPDHSLKLHYAHKASILFSSINHQEGIGQALDILSDTIFKFGRESSHLHQIKLKDETVQNFESIREKVFEFFSDTKRNLEERIFDLAFINIEREEINGSPRGIIFYRPFTELKAIEESDKQLSGSILSQIMPSVHLSGNKVIGIDERNIEAKSFCYSTHFQFNVLPAMEALRKDKDFNLAYLLNYIKSSEIVTERDIPFIEEAMEHFFNKKYISFLSVLVPTIESLLRRIYELYNGTDIMIQRKNNNLQTTVNLTEILKDENVKDNLSEDFIGYLQYLLNDDTSSENIRNNVAHRFTSADFYNEGRSLIVLHLLLLIITYFQFID